MMWAVTRAVIYAGAFLAIAVAIGTIPLGAALPIFLLAPLTGLLFAALGMIYKSLVPVIDMYSFYYTLS